MIMARALALVALAMCLATAARAWAQTAAPGAVDSAAGVGSGAVPGHAHGEIAPAHADGTEGSGPAWSDLGPWERRLAERELGELGFRAATATPDQTPVCAVHVRRLPVFGPDDPWPEWPNRLHVLSRERVVRQRLTLVTGDAYSEAARRESQRSLRDGRIYAMASVLPVVSDETGCIDLLVLTRDTWSLRPTLFWTFAGVLTDFQLGLLDVNLAGTNQTLATTFTLGRGDWSITPSWTADRLGRTPLAAAATLSVIFDREDHSALDGTSHGFELRDPLRTIEDRWSWRVATSHAARTQRYWVGSALQTWDDPETAAVEEVPWRWAERSVAASASMGRTWGSQTRIQLRWGFRGSSRVIEADPRQPVDPTLLARFEREALAPSERVIGPTLGWGLWQERFFSVVDYASFRISEEIRAGGSADLDVGLSEPAIGSSDRWVSPGLTLGWLEPIGRSGLFAVRAGLSSRLDSDGPRDLLVSGAVRAVSPRSAGGRLVARAEAGWRPFNQSNARTALGSDAGLRGYAAGALAGEHWVRTNVEWRTPSVRILSTFLGAAAFSDGAMAWSNAEVPQWMPSVGVGLRWVIPQVGTVVRAIDIGFPLRRFRPLTIGGTSLGVPSPVLSISLDQPF